MANNKQYYSIGEVSRISNLSQKTLRYYQQLGLIIPDHVDSDSSYRYYTRDQFFRIYIIRRLQEYGFSLQEIKELFNTNDVESYQNAIRKKMETIKQQLHKLELTLRDADQLIDRLSMLSDNNTTATNGNGIEKDWLLQKDSIIVEPQAERLVLFNKQQRSRFVYATVYAEHWLELYNQAKDNDLTVTGSIIFCYHTQSPLEQFFNPNTLIEVLLPIEETDTSRNDTRIFGGFLAAVTQHIGPYSTIINTHTELLRWITENDYVLDGPICEECLVSPFDLDLQSDYITKIIAPIRKK